MKRFWLLLPLILIMVGCATKLVEKPRYLLSVKTSQVFIGEINIFTGMETDITRIKNIGKLVSADNIYYQKLAEEYRKTLKTKLRNRGFTIVDQSTPDSLIVKTKIGYKPLPSGKFVRLLTHGRVGVQVELFQGDKLFLNFEATVPTAYIAAGPRSAIQSLASFVARTIKKAT